MNLTKQKSWVIYSILIISLGMIYNCGTQELTSADSWKEKYKIEPNTGVLAGKILAKDFLKGKKVFVFLTDKINGNLIAHDVLSTDGYFLIKNLPKGKYFIGIRGDELYFVKENIPMGIMGFYTFSGYSCNSFYIEIEPGIIKFIEAETPGNSTAQMSAVREKGYPESKGDVDSCEIKYDREILNEKNYTKINTFIKEDR